MAAPQPSPFLADNCQPRPLGAAGAPAASYTVQTGACWLCAAHPSTLPPTFPARLTMPAPLAHPRSTHYDVLAVASHPRASTDDDVTEFNPRTKRGKMILAAAEKLVSGLLLPPTGWLQIDGC